MPQKDRHKNRTVPIEFVHFEDFSAFPYASRYSLTFVTDGGVKGVINGRPFAVFAPGVLCVSPGDTAVIQKTGDTAAQTFCFHPDFFSSIPVTESQDYVSSNLKIQTGLSLFGGTPAVTPSAFPQLKEWFFALGTEVFAQSDALWCCRIKRYMIQILGMLEDLSRQSEKTPADLALEYIHTNYPEKISLADLTGCAHLNRVSLNEAFRERCGRTAMGYLTAHRLKVAADLLTHTNMSLNEIARSTGFEYDTYFIKQFTRRRGMSPTAYRQSSRKLAAAR